MRKSYGKTSERNLSMCKNDTSRHDDDDDGFSVLIDKRAPSEG